MWEDVKAVLESVWAQIAELVGGALDWAERLVETLGLRIMSQVETWLIAAGWTDPSDQRFAVATALVTLTALVLLGILIAVRRGHHRATGRALADLTRRPRRFGFAAAIVLVLVFGGWSLLSPLASAALATGVVSPDGSRKTVEHLEGGIVRAIHVREGDLVTEGMALITLEDIQARAHYDGMRERYLYLLASEARLSAERYGKEEIVFPIELAGAKDPGAWRIIEAQREVLRSRRATQLGRERILEQRIRQLEEQNDGLVEVIAAQDEQVSLLAEEIEAVQKLYDRGLEKYPRLLALKRAQADLAAQKASHRARIAENGPRIGETEIQLLTMREQALERTNDELAETQRQLAEVTSQMPSREDVLGRTVIRAPISGTVMNIGPTTVTGVIRPGEPILQIVPGDVTLIIDAHVRPNDIDRVHPGMEARVMLTAYKQRSLPLIHGTLRSISADRLVDDRSGEPYFLAKVEVKPEDLARLEDVRLMPGMPAEIMILNEERTLFDYLLSPILDSMRKSFKES